MSISLKICHISKTYKIYPNKWARLFEWFSLFGKHYHRKHLVLDNVDFVVHQGESVGILGVNGAGKSTLLKIITGITVPTKGNVLVNGRVAALLELGMGFHPEFTGRQNVYMAAQLQSISEKDTDAVFKEIESFADIGHFIDMPLRTYSSGMQMRLAFAVATAYRPDILIVDEALSVGDAAFQKKCFSRIESFQEKGTALLIVSHSIETINRICTKAILLSQGKMAAHGNTKEVTQIYEEMLYGTKHQNSTDIHRAEPFFENTLASHPIERQYGNLQAVIENFKILNNVDQPANIFYTKQPITVSYDVRFHQSVKAVHFGIMIKTVEEICVYGTSTEHSQPKQDYLAGEVINIRFELENHLSPGTYYINCGCNSLVDSDRVFLHRRVDVCIFRVMPAGALDTMIGLSNLDAKTTIKPIERIHQ